MQLKAIFYLENNLGSFFLPFLAKMRILKCLLELLYIYSINVPEAVFHISSKITLMLKKRWEMNNNILSSVWVIKNKYKRHGMSTAGVHACAYVFLHIPWRSSKAWSWKRAGDQEFLHWTLWCPGQSISLN